MSKVLITGGAGTIGYFLCKSLYQQGHDITLIDDLSRGKLDLELKELLQTELNFSFLRMEKYQDNMIQAMKKIVYYILIQMIF